ncbi:MAG: hypothetical protein LIO57_05850, partial [Oscillospiraceae bacterium]|nr:hypothetical protein [Oscillospiraceae bacterium]
FILYLDTYGNLIGFEAADDSSSSAVTKNYLYVKSADADYYDSFDDAYVKIKAQFTDGTTAVVYLNVSNEDDSEKASVKIPVEQTDGTFKTETFYVIKDNLNNVIDAVAGKIFAYTVNSSGYYTLKSIGTKAEQYGYISVDDVSAVKLGDSSTSTDTKYATSTTKLVLVDDGKTYTGYSNFPDDSYTTPVLAIYTNTSKTRLTYLYVFGDEVSTAEDLVYAMYKGVGDSTGDGTYYDFYVGGSVVSYLFDDDDYSNNSFTAYEAGWIEIGSDGYSDFYGYSEYSTEVGYYNIDSDETNESIYYATYKDDYYIYAGEVVTKSSDSIGVDINGDGDEDFVFALADDYEKTRVKTGSSRSATAASEGDYVWVFTEDEAVSNSMSAEAVAVIAVNSDITAAATYFGGLTLYTD